MAQQIKMEMEPAVRGEHLDRYYAQVDDWFIEIRVPKGTEMTTADIHFKFANQTPMQKLRGSRK